MFLLVRSCFTVRIFLIALQEGNYFEEELRWVVPTEFERENILTTEVIQIS